MERLTFQDAFTNVKQAAANDLTLTTLRAAIIIVALLFIAFALTIKNKMVLAVMFAYLVLP